MDVINCLLTLTQKSHFVVVAQRGQLLGVETDETLAAACLEQEVLDEGSSRGVEGVVGASHSALGTNRLLSPSADLLEFLRKRETRERA